MTTVLIYKHQKGIQGGQSQIQYFSLLLVACFGSYKKATSGN